MPELPTPCTNGQSAPTQGPSSISSFEPAASTEGLVGSTATVGSFCLFCGNGEGGLPVLTRASEPSATAGTAPNESTPRTTANQRRFSIRFPPVCLPTQDLIAGIAFVKTYQVVLI